MAFLYSDWLYFLWHGINTDMLFAGWEVRTVKKKEYVRGHS